MRIGTDGKTAEMRRTGRRWRKPLAQFGEKVWFRRIGEDGGSSYASRMTQGRFVGHHDRTGATLCMTGKGVVRGKSWTRQALEDAWDRAGWGDLCGTPWEMLAKETKLEKKVTADKDGKGEPLPNPPGVERAPEVAPRRFYVLTADIEAHGATPLCPGCESIAIHGRAKRAHSDECRERIRELLERSLEGRARMEAYRQRVAAHPAGPAREAAAEPAAPPAPTGGGDEQMRADEEGDGRVAGERQEARGVPRETLRVPQEVIEAKRAAGDPQGERPSTRARSATPRGVKIPGEGGGEPARKERRRSPSVEVRGVRLVG
eukprot:9473684-Pyramimonas_sp.AAC.1